MYYHLGKTDEAKLKDLIDPNTGAAYFSVDRGNYFGTTGGADRITDALAISWQKKLYLEYVYTPDENYRMYLLKASRDMINVESIDSDDTKNVLIEYILAELNRQDGNMGVYLDIDAKSNDSTLGKVTGAGYVSFGENVVLTAVPYTNCTFAGWVDVVTGETLSDSATYTFMATNSVNVVANFVAGEAETATTPSISYNFSDSKYYTGDTAKELSVSASVNDGGTITVSWYRNTVNSTSSGTLVGSGKTFIPSTENSGIYYYYAIVKNTLNYKVGTQTITTTAQTTTDVVKIEVFDPIVAKNAVTAEGFSVRMNKYTGLRALFSFDQTVAAVNEYNGLTLVSYGVIASSYARFMNDFGGDENALFAEARKNTNNALKYIPVYNADGTGANKYVDYTTRTFCITLTNISSGNSLSDVYMAGYAIWKDRAGNETYTITTYDMADSEKAVNLYEITLGLTKSGIINSENTEDLCFWQVLKNGALKVDDFTYADVDWHAYTGNTTADGYEFDPTGVDTQASGVVWSVLRCTDDEYVLVYRNKDKNVYTSLAIPQYTTENSKYGFYAPFDYRYGSTENIGSATLTTYNPALSQAEYEKIKTVVVDHGITATASGGLSGFRYVETIVYPNGLSGVGDSKFSANTALKNVIWCHVDNNGNPVTHMSEFDGLTSLLDLRGLNNLDLNALVSDASLVENIVLPAEVNAGFVEDMLNETSALLRIWTEDAEMPAEGVVDISRTGITGLGKAAFNVGSGISKIILPDTVVSIATDFDPSSVDVKYWQTFGQSKSIDYICNDAIAELIAEYVSYIRTNPCMTNEPTVSFADKIKVNSTPILTLIS